jgi:hypothetical protein
VVHDHIGVAEVADMEFSRVFTLRERKLIDIDIFWDHAEALEATGLSE